MNEKVTKTIKNRRNERKLLFQIKMEDKQRQNLFWYLAGIITMIGLYTLAWLIETLLSQN